MGGKWTLTNHLRVALALPVSKRIRSDRPTSEFRAVRDVTQDPARTLGIALYAIAAILVAFWVNASAILVG